MKVARFLSADGPSVGVVDGPGIRAAGEDPLKPRPTGPAMPWSSVQLLSPLPRPGKIVCVGLNYYDHAAESQMQVPTAPLLFTKFANAVIGPGDSIRLPRNSNQVDYEAELAVIIGEETRDVPVASALGKVYGYACANDVSARDFQFADGQWFRGKGQDTFCPLGPWIVTRDEVPDPQTLPIRCKVNGQVLQDDTTANMIFPVAELVSYISTGITLDPGDVILTGTPVGVGFARTPPLFLADGDTVTVEIEGIGELTNRVAMTSSVETA
jgi:2-keto-4-pentenoate hydratase/2-oxohepta-3-ene-1,7-dioic acid hydratase in catechol pathway